MKMNTENIIAKNRAEEFGYDLWEEFVIPPYFGELEIMHSRKPNIIVGGRGCGKTMLLRYLCHETQFSSKRSYIQSNALNRIGLYWKIDTQFSKTMTKRGEEENIWSSAFVHMGVLILGLEILKSLESIQKSSLLLNDQNFLTSFDFSALEGFDSSIPNGFNNLKDYLKKSFNQFQMWVGNYRKLSAPNFFPLAFIKELISLIKAQNHLLRNSDFNVYIDEYENLLPEQKRIVNTWVKHSESPLIFNLAMKRNAFGERMTVGNEQIAGIHDYREFDIEILLDRYYEIFAAEILLLRLQKYGINNSILADDLFSVAEEIIETRKSVNYKNLTLNRVKEIFPGYSQKELAEIVIKDKILNNRIKELLKKALEKRKSKSSYEEYFDENYPEVMVVLFALLNRKSIEEVTILKELDLLKSGEPNSFTNSTGWVHNNFIGCLLFLYSTLGRICPLYSGFDTFCKMSKGNIRHFLELCFKSIANSNTPDKSVQYIDQKNQAAAVKQVSTSLLKEVRALGSQGNSLYSFVIRLGTIFEYCRDNPAQSEPEQNHFTIKNDTSKDTQDFLDELVKWSVLYEEKLTKQKGTESGVEYILNPIYSSYFSISFRKKRRIVFSDEEFRIIAFADLVSYEKLIRKKYKQESGLMPNLFELFD